MVAESSAGRQRLPASSRAAVAIAIGCAVVAAVIVAVGPDRGGAVLDPAREAVRRQDWEAATTILDRVERGLPRGRGPRGEIELLRGRILRRQGRAAEAESRFAAAEALGARPVEIRLQRLLAAVQTGTGTQAEAELPDMLAADVPDDIAEECYEAMTRGYVASFRLDEAARCVQFWSEGQPDSCRPWLWQGLLEERLERAGNALEAYRTALAREPEAYEPLVSVARLELETGRIDEAASRFAACRDRRPDDTDAVLGLAACLLRSGDTDRAAALLREALTLDIDPARAAGALADLGQLAIEDSDAGRALNLYRQAAVLDPGEPRIRQGLAAALGRLGEREGAAGELAAAARLGDLRRRITAARRQCIGDQGNAGLRREMGAALLAAGDPTEAARWLETALQIDSGDAETRRLLAECGGARGNPAGAGPPPEKPDGNR